MLIETKTLTLLQKEGTRSKSRQVDTGKDILMSIKVQTTIVIKAIKETGEQPDGQIQEAEKILETINKNARSESRI